MTSAGSFASELLRVPAKCGLPPHCLPGVRTEGLVYEYVVPSGSWAPGAAGVSDIRRHLYADAFQPVEGGQDGVRESLMAINMLCVLLEAVSDSLPVTQKGTVQEKREARQLLAASKREEERLAAAQLDGEVDVQMDTAPGEHQGEPDDEDATRALQEAAEKEDANRLLHQKCAAEIFNELDLESRRWKAHYTLLDNAGEEDGPVPPLHVDPEWHKGLMGARAKISAMNADRRDEDGFVYRDNHELDQDVQRAQAMTDCVRERLQNFVIFGEEDALRGARDALKQADDATRMRLNTQKALSHTLPSYSAAVAAGCADEAGSTAGDVPEPAPAVAAAAAAAPVAGAPAAGGSGKKEYPRKWFLPAGSKTMLENCTVLSEQLFHKIVYVDAECTVVDKARTLEKPGNRAGMSYRIYVNDPTQCLNEALQRTLDQHMARSQSGTKGSHQAYNPPEDNGDGLGGGMGKAPEDRPVSTRASAVSSSAVRAGQKRASAENRASENKRASKRRREGEGNSYIGRESADEDEEEPEQEQAEEEGDEHPEGGGGGKQRSAVNVAAALAAAGMASAGLLGADAGEERDEGEAEEDGQVDYERMYGAPGAKALNPKRSFTGPVREIFAAELRRGEEYFSGEDEAKCYAVASAKNWRIVRKFFPDGKQESESEAADCRGLGGRTGDSLGRSNGFTLLQEFGSIVLKTLGAGVVNAVTAQMEANLAVSRVETAVQEGVGLRTAIKDTVAVLNDPEEREAENWGKAMKGKKAKKGGKKGEAEALMESVVSMLAAQSEQQGKRKKKDVTQVYYHNPAMQSLGAMGAYYIKSTADLVDQCVLPFAPELFPEGVPPHFFGRFTDLIQSYSSMVPDAEEFLSPYAATRLKHRYGVCAEQCGRGWDDDQAALDPLRLRLQRYAAWRGDGEVQEWEDTGEEIGGKRRRRPVRVERPVNNVGDTFENPWLNADMDCFFHDITPWFTTQDYIITEFADSDFPMRSLCRKIIRAQAHCGLEPSADLVPMTHKASSDLAIKASKHTYLMTRQLLQETAIVKPLNMGLEDEEEEELPYEETTVSRHATGMKSLNDALLRLAAPDLTAFPAKAGQTANETLAAIQAEFGQVPATRGLPRWWPETTGRTIMTPYDLYVAVRASFLDFGFWHLQNTLTSPGVANPVDNAHLRQAERKGYWRKVMPFSVEALVLDGVNHSDQIKAMMYAHTTDGAYVQYVQNVIAHSLYGRVCAQMSNVKPRIMTPSQWIPADQSSSKSYAQGVVKKWCIEGTWMEIGHQSQNAARTNTRTEGYVVFMDEADPCFYVDNPTGDTLLKRQGWQQLLSNYGMAKDTVRYNSDGAKKKTLEVVKLRGTFYVYLMAASNFEMSKGNPLASRLHTERLVYPAADRVEPIYRSDADRAMHVQGGDAGGDIEIVQSITDMWRFIFHITWFLSHCASFYLLPIETTVALHQMEKYLSCLGAFFDQVGQFTDQARGMEMLRNMLRADAVTAAAWAATVSAYTSCNRPGPGRAPDRHFDPREVMDCARHYCYVSEERALVHNDDELFPVMVPVFDYQVLDGTVAKCFRWDKESWPDRCRYALLRQGMDNAGAVDRASGAVIPPLTSAEQQDYAALRRRFQQSDEEEHRLKFWNLTHDGRAERPGVSGPSKHCNGRSKHYAQTSGRTGRPHVRSVLSDGGGGGGYASETDQERLTVPEVFSVGQYKGGDNHMHKLLAAKVNNRRASQVEGMRVHLNELKAGYGRAKGSKQAEIDAEIRSTIEKMKAYRNADPMEPNGVGYDPNYLWLDGITLDELIAGVSKSMRLSQDQVRKAYERMCSQLVKVPILWDASDPSSCADVGPGGTLGQLAEYLIVTVGEDNCFTTNPLKRTGFHMDSVGAEPVPLQYERLPMMIVHSNPKGGSGKGHAGGPLPCVGFLTVPALFTSVREIRYEALRGCADHFTPDNRTLLVKDTRDPTVLFPLWTPRRRGRPATRYEGKKIPKVLRTWVAEEAPGDAAAERGGSGSANLVVALPYSLTHLGLSKMNRVNGVTAHDNPTLDVPDEVMALVDPNLFGTDPPQNPDGSYVGYRGNYPGTVQMHALLGHYQQEGAAGLARRMQTKYPECVRTPAPNMSIPAQHAAAETTFRDAMMARALTGDNAARDWFTVQELAVAEATYGLSGVDLG
jgi:hypothetical protein